MNKKQVVIFIGIFMITMIGAVFFLNKVNIEGSTDVQINNNKETVTVGIGEICKSPTVNFDCEEGYLCATKDLNLNIEPYKEFGFCTPKELIK